MIDLPTNAPRVIVVDPKLSYIVSQVESAGFAGALRFEPSVYGTIKGLTNDSNPPTKGTELVQVVARVNRCTIETAEVLYSTSFGLYQLMGYNLYRLGLHMPVSEFLSGTHGRMLQDALFAIFLSDRNINFKWNEMASDPDKLNRFAEHYNGSLAYGGRMKAIAREHYGEKLV